MDSGQTGKERVGVIYTEITVFREDECSRRDSNPGDELGRLES